RLQGSFAGRASSDGESPTVLVESAARSAKRVRIAGYSTGLGQTIILTEAFKSKILDTRFRRDGAIVARRAIRNHRAPGLHAERRVPGKREQSGRGRRQRRSGRHLHRGDESPPRRGESRGERPVPVGPERRGHRRVAVLPEAGLLAKGQRPAPYPGRGEVGRRRFGKRLSPSSRMVA